MQEWTEQNPASSPSDRSDAAMAFDPTTGQTVLFGGYDTGYLGDTWVWDGTTWAQMNPNASPAPRRGAAMTFDPISGQVLLTGGRDGSVVYHDTWLWDGITWAELNLTPTPPAVSGASMAFDQGSGEMVLFGGEGASSQSNETWIWNKSGWTQKSPATSPSARSQASMAFDPGTGKVILFGGSAGQASGLGDTWSWDGSNWTQETPADSPSERHGSAITFDPSIGKILLFGGVSAGTFSDETWSWDGENWVEETATGPAARSAASLAFDETTGLVLLFGGENSSGPLGGTWTFGPPAGMSPTWRLEDPAMSMPNLSESAMAFDPSTGEAVLFGGYGPGHSDRTFTWDGENWTEEFPAHHPTPRSGASMAFDPANGEIVMFGGYGPGYDRDETWTWDGEDWTQRSPADSPPGRFTSSMVFDPSIGKILLFGGNGGGGIFDRGDTWTWDGNNWTELHPADSPSARSGAAMFFDPSSGDPVLFGGSTNSDETWAWNGVNWIQRNPATKPPGAFEGGGDFFSPGGYGFIFGGMSAGETWAWEEDNWTELPVAGPPARRSIAMTFMPSAGEMVMFGGYSGQAEYWNQTWTYSYRPDVPTAVISAPSGGQTYKAGQTVATTFSCEDGQYGPGIATCEDPGGNSAPTGRLDTSSLGAHVYTVTATSKSNLTGTDQISYEVEKAEPTATVAASSAEVEIGQPLTSTATLADSFQPSGDVVFRLYGPDDGDCSAAPVFESDPVPANGDAEVDSPGFTADELGTYRWTVSYAGDSLNEPAASTCGDTGSVSVVIPAAPTLVAGFATNAKLGDGVSAKAMLSGSHRATGQLVFRAYGPDDTTCSGAPAFESSALTVEDNVLFVSPEFAATEPGQYRWVASYSGDAENQPAVSSCGEEGSVSTVSEPSPPKYKCPKARPGLKLSAFPLRPPYGNANKVIGIRVSFRSKNAVVEVKPTMTYRVAGKKRTVGLKTRTLKVNGVRDLRFKAPARLKQDFRKAGIPVRRAPVTFKVKAKIRPQGSRANCFRNLGTRQLKSRLGNVSGRVALRRLGF